MAEPGWRPTGADPAAPRVEFRPQRTDPVPTDPRLDPPTTMRVRDWSARNEPTVQRAVATDNRYDDRRWVLVTGIGADLPLQLSDDDVADWPTITDIHTAIAFRDWARARAARPAAVLDGSDTEGDRLFR